MTMCKQRVTQSDEPTENDRFHLQLLLALKGFIVSFLDVFSGSSRQLFSEKYPENLMYITGSAPNHQTETFRH